MKKVITTVGMSLWQNAKNKNVPLSTRLENDSYDKCGQSSIDFEKNKRILNIWSKSNLNACAEIASLIKIQAELKEKIEVHFICTETILSRLCAECIETWFKEHGKDYPSVFFGNSEKVVDSLLVTNKATFEKGLANLFEKLEKDVVPKKDNKLDWSNIILNITGGYKALIPHLTILGQIYRCPIYYVFDEVKDQPNYELIKVPTLPINFDWLVGEIYGQMLTPFGIKNFADDNDLAKLVNYGLVKPNREVDTFGKLMWKYMNSKMPESPQTMGFFVEFLFYEYFNEHRGEVYTDIPLRGLQLYWDGENTTEISDVKTDTLKNIRNEFDIILRGLDSYAFVEVKSVLQIKELLKNDNLKKKIEALEIFYKSGASDFILTIYKNPKIRLDVEEHIDDLKAIELICQSCKIKFSAHWIDFEVRKKDNEAFDFSEFLKTKIKKENFDNNKIKI